MQLDKDMKEQSWRPVETHTLQIWLFLTIAHLHDQSKFKEK